MSEPVLQQAVLIEEEFARLCESDTMRRAPSHMRLLRYLVEKSMAGDASALRETAIALEVFRRDPAVYDPKSDPIVRVTTGRLRARLEAHYAHYDAPPKLRIVLPKGSYAPEFIAQKGAAVVPVGLAVLHARNQTGDAALDDCCSEFTDMLADRLVRAGLPRVMARGSVEQAKVESRDPTVIGVQLGVPWLLESTLSCEHRQDLRLSVRLVDTGDASVRWVETGVGPVDDVDRVVDKMLDLACLRVLETLPAGVALGTAAHASMALPASTRAAIDQARLLLLQRTLAGADDAIVLADSVAREHPDAAEAWAIVAAALYSRLSFRDRDQGPIADRLRAAADRALVLDPDQPMALRTKAIMVGKWDCDAEGAEQLFVRVLRTMPHYTSARINYAEILTLLGQFDEALTQLNLAHHYDPLSATVHLARAICLGYQRKYDQAREAYALCRASGEASLWVLTGAGMNELAAGNLDAAALLLSDAEKRFPDMQAAVLSHAILRAVEGDHERARAIERECIDRFPHCSPANRAVLAALLHDKDGTLLLLTQAYAMHDMALLPATMHPAFDWLTDDADFLQLRSKCPTWARRVERRASQGTFALERPRRLEPGGFQP
jgi:tetratricopeptide (TPR) repeat protein